MIKCVLFDLDETLFDRAFTLERFLVIQFAQFLKFLGQTTQREWVAKFIELDARGQKSKRRLYPEILQLFNGDQLASERLITHYFEKSTRDAIAVSGMDELLDSLTAKGVPIGIITNGETELQSRTIEALGLDRRTRMVLISESVGFRKPDRRIFELAAQQMKMDLHECLFVGDNPTADVLGAHRAGMRVLWFNRYHAAWPSERPNMPGHKIHDLRNVLDHLE